MNDENFLNSYKTLNENQKKAVDTIDGPVMVIAGPGTGKTTILTLRIANILRNTDTDPKSILALTFTESAVSAMRKKLVKIIGARAYDVSINTFHGFCNGLIKENPELFERIINSNQSTESDQISVIEKIIEENKWTYLKPLGDKFFYVSEIRQSISHLKRENFDSESYKKYCENLLIEFNQDKENYSKKSDYKDLKKTSYSKKRKIERSIEFSDFYRIYNEKMAEAKKYDFDDMILEVLKVMKENQDFLFDIQEMYQYLLADEHQDVNHAQNQILELIADYHENPNIFIVGDEKQAIFRFQGASLENFLYFKSKFPGALMVKLDQNYRSTQNILDGAFSLIGKNKTNEDLIVELKSPRKEGSVSINVVKTNTIDGQYFEIARSIKEKIEKGENPNEIAIIYRKNRESGEIAKYLESQEIRYSIKSNQNVLDQDDVRKLRLLFEAAGDLNNNERIAEMLFVDWFQANPIDVHKIISYSRKEDKNIIDVLGNEKELVSAKIKDVVAFVELGKRMSDFSTYSKNNHAEKTFVYILNKSGLLDNILNSETSLERLYSINVFYDELQSESSEKSGYRISDFVDHLDRIESYGLKIKTKDMFNVGGVNLMTAHSAKGLEYNSVYIPNSVSKFWGKGNTKKMFVLPFGNIKDSEHDVVEDERRLFYVAITRARNDVNLFLSNFSADGAELLPTQFIEEIDKGLVNYVEVEEREKGQEIFDTKFRLIENRIGDHDKEYLKNLFLSESISVTALNNYLECPWKYFYLNLIRIPETYTNSQVYGNAVHNGLKESFEKSNGKNLDYGIFIEAFNKTLQKSILDKKDIQDLSEKGEKELPKYFETISFDDKDEIMTEYSVNNVPFEYGSETISLKGKIDRIDLDTKQGVIVTDYKTGKPKTRGQIMGQTKDSNGNIFRQLTFYRLLLNHSKPDWKIKNMVIDFVEPDEDDFRREIFDISEEDVNVLKAEIGNFIDDVINFKFWNKKCLDEKCKYCRLTRPH